RPRDGNYPTRVLGSLRRRVTRGSLLCPSTFGGRNEAVKMRELFVNNGIVYRRKELGVASAGRNAAPWTGRCLAVRALVPPCVGVTVRRCHHALVLPCVGATASTARNLHLFMFQSFGGRRQLCHLEVNIMQTAPDPTSLSANTAVSRQNQITDCIEACVACE